MTPFTLSRRLLLAVGILGVAGTSTVVVVHARRHDVSVSLHGGYSVYPTVELPAGSYHLVATEYDCPGAALSFYLDLASVGHGTGNKVVIGEGGNGRTETDFRVDHQNTYVLGSTNTLMADETNCQIIVTITSNRSWF